jgi:hypothetical protein
MYSSTDVPKIIKEASDLEPPRESNPGPTHYELADASFAGRGARPFTLLTLLTPITGPRGIALNDPELSP